MKVNVPNPSSAQSVPQSPPCPKSVVSTAEDLSVAYKRNLVPDDARSSWLPSDHEEQLSVGMRIISGAFKHRQSAHDAEMRVMKQQADDVNKVNGQLREKINQLEFELMEVRNRLSASKEENLTVTKMLHRVQNRNTHLESIRKAVLSSIQDNNDGTSINTGEMTPDIYEMNTGSYAVEYGGKSPSRRVTGGNVTYAPMSASSHQDVMSNVHATTASPPRRAMETRANSSIRSNSHTATGVTQQRQPEAGRAFFHVIRERVDYAKYKEFVAIVRDLNQNKITHTEVLARAGTILGPENTDLMEGFANLLDQWSQRDCTMTEPSCS